MKKKDPFDEAHKWRRSLTKEQTKKFLQDCGILTEQGDLAEPYATGKIPKS